MSAAQQWWAKHGWWAPFSLGLIASALALAALIIEIPDRHWWATSLQLLGASVAFGGFWSAYVRAARGLTLWQQFRLWAKRFAGWLRRVWVKLRRKRVDQVISPSSAMSAAGMFAPTVTATGIVLVDPSAPLDVQVARLVDFANDAAKRLTELEKHIGRLDGRIDKAVADAARGMADTLAHIESQIEQLKTRLDRAQVLDLRWAIAGLFISVVGTALSY